MQHTATRSRCTLPRGVRAVLLSASAAIVLTTGTASATTEPPPSASGPSGGLEIVWVEQGAGNPYWDAQHAAAAEAADRLGFDFRVVSGDLDPAVQASVVQQTVDQQPDAIMVNAIDPSAIAEAYQYAADNGVPIVNLYGLDENATASITFDEIRTGEMMAEYALGLLQARYGEPSGDVTVLHGILGQPASDLRAQGFIDYMEANGVQIADVQPTNWQADEASATMENWLTRYPELSLVYSLSDTLTVPAMNIAERQDRLCRNDVEPAELGNCVIFISVDGIFSNEVVDGRMWATAPYSPEWSGFKFAELAYAVASGGDYEPENVINSMLVTPENAECVVEMTTAMSENLTDFPFEGTLQEIAENEYGCTVLDQPGGVPATSAPTPTAPVTTAQ
jgi:ribose transport system substrate-binding protein